MQSYSPICVDASFIIRLIETPPNQGIGTLWQRWQAENRPIVAPALLLYEVTNALYKYVRQGLLTSEELDLALIDVDALNIALIENREMHRQAARLAQEFGLRAAYDAHYLALAQQMNAEFWTFDARLVKSVSQALPWVHLAA